MVKVLLVSTYELGRQPFGLASPAAWLRHAGVTVRCVDSTRDPLPEAAVRDATLIAFHLPMHTATRLSVPLIERVRRWNPSAHLCCYGLYAPLNQATLRSLGVATILGAEFEADLVALARSLEAPATGTAALPAGPATLPRLQFLQPDRSDLPSLTRYASLQLGPGQRRVVGYTEASRGCKHLCRHCPVVPIYNGQFRIVQRAVVLSDIRAQVAAGAQHITFGDPDFFNGVRHAVDLVTAFAREHPDVTYDVTIKIEHLLKHAAHLPALRDTGCLFVTSAVESVNDEVLALLEKHHTRADFVRAVRICREAGLTLSPTFVPFTPWTGLDGYRDLLDTLDELDLVDHVAPIQLAIRLLIPEGSRLLELESVRGMVGPFDSDILAYRWRHADPQVDALQRSVAALVGVYVNRPRREVFDCIAALAFAPGERVARPRSAPARPRATVPYLNEPWYC